MYKSNLKSSCVIKMTFLYLLQTYTVMCWYTVKVCGFSQIIGLIFLLEGKWSNRRFISLLVHQEARINHSCQARSSQESSE